MSILTFMGEHPVLTFFLALIFTNCVVKSIAAIRGHFDEHCDDCNCSKNDDL